jgi:murein DD-endopeptidase MepM/ murein hydrolase activator NlpD
MTKNYFIAAVVLVLYLTSCKQDHNTPIEAYDESIPVVIEPIMKYGFDLNEFEIIADTVQRGATFNDLIISHIVEGQSAYHTANRLNKIYDLRRIQAGKPFKILKRKDSIGTPEVFIYEPTKLDYVVVNFNDTIAAYRNKHPISFKRKTASGIINSTLSEAMAAEGLGLSAIYELSDIYRWSIDFFKLQQGDRFKMIYKERYINDSIYAGIESIEAAVFETDETPFYAFDYLTDSITGMGDYYDDNGKTLRSFFLKAPVNYSRISSRFTKRRFHPVQKRWKAHKGTDYAAGYGTPIVATANGTVTKSGYTGGNGNYVKIKHDATYSTQYLHMTKRKVKVGQRVKQGQIIGTVGSTGLATGPHVCYRFWAHGKQVDPYKQNLPSAEPLPKNRMQDYLQFIVPLKEEIDQLPFKTDHPIL